MFTKYYRIELSEKEYRLILNGLVEYKNQQISDGRYTDAIDDVILKVCEAPTRRRLKFKKQ